jgi:hypothetical protein
MTYDTFDIPKSGIDGSKIVKLFLKEILKRGTIQEYIIRDNMASHEQLWLKFTENGYVTTPNNVVPVKVCQWCCAPNLLTPCKN